MDKSLMEYLGYIAFLGLFVYVFIWGWDYQYSGKIIEEFKGVVIKEQYVSRRQYKPAYVRLKNNKTVTADCKNKYRGERVTLVSIEGKLTGHLLYKCL